MITGSQIVATRRCLPLGPSRSVRRTTSADYSRRADVGLAVFPSALEGDMSSSSLEVEEEPEEPDEELTLSSLPAAPAAELFALGREPE